MFRVLFHTRDFQPISQPRFIFKPLACSCALFLTLSHAGYLEIIEVLRGREGRVRVDKGG
ncbi:MAG: hypothetical protein WBV22_02245 [Anaerolineaceae bacterium]